MSSLCSAAVSWISTARVSKVAQFFEEPISQVDSEASGSELSNSFLRETEIGLQCAAFSTKKTMFTAFWASVD
jgi:hypothetical protein